jgi:hypothetical protein
MEDIIKQLEDAVTWLEKAACTADSGTFDILVFVRLAIQNALNTARAELQETRRVALEKSLRNSMGI